MIEKKKKKKKIIYIPSLDPLNPSSVQWSMNNSPNLFAMNIQELSLKIKEQSATYVLHFGERGMMGVHALEEVQLI